LPGQGGQHNKHLGIVAAGRYRQGRRLKDEDRIAVHAEWLSTRRSEAARLLAKGRGLPGGMTEAERRLLLPGTDGSAAGAGEGDDDRQDTALREGEPLGTRVGVFVVLDGHGGDEVSDRLSKRMSGALVRALSAPTPEDADAAHARHEVAMRAAEAGGEAAEAGGAAEQSTPSQAAGSLLSSSSSASASGAAARPHAGLPDWAVPRDTSRQHLTRMAGSPAGPKVTFNPPVSATARRCVSGDALRDRLRWFCRAMDKWVIDEAAAPMQSRAATSTQAGTCLAAATVVGDSLVLFNVGDCEAVLSVRGRPVLLSFAHKATAPSEVARISAAGRRVVNYNGVMRTEGVLAVTRSIGVASLKDRFPGAVIPDPFVRVVQLTGDEEFLVMGSDGLFDKFPQHQDLVSTVKRLLRETKDAAQTANMLLDEAIDVRASQDNASCVIVVFNQAGPPVDPATGRPRCTAECWGWGRGVGYAAKAAGRPAIPVRRPRAQSSIAPRPRPGAGSEDGGDGDGRGEDGGGDTAEAAADDTGDDATRQGASRGDESWDDDSVSRSLSPEPQGLSFATEQDAVKWARRQAMRRHHSVEGDDTATGEVGEDGEDLSSAAAAAGGAAGQAPGPDAGSECGSEGAGSAVSASNGVVLQADSGHAGSRSGSTAPARLAGEDDAAPADPGAASPSEGAAGGADAPAPAAAAGRGPGSGSSAEAGVAMRGRPRRATVDSHRASSLQDLRAEVARGAAEAARRRNVDGRDLEAAAEGLGEGQPEATPEDV